MALNHRQLRITAARTPAATLTRTISSGTRIGTTRAPASGVKATKAFTAPAAAQVRAEVCLVLFAPGGAVAVLQHHLHPQAAPVLLHQCLGHRRQGQLLHGHPHLAPGATDRLQQHGLQIVAAALLATDRAAVVHSGPLVEGHRDPRWQRQERSSVTEHPAGHAAAGQAQAQGQEQRSQAAHRARPQVWNQGVHHRARSD